MVMSHIHQVWPNHLARHSERGKKTRQTKDEGRRRHGRQTMRWGDTFREWTDLEFAKSQRAVENSEK